MTPTTFGARLRAAMREANVRNPDVADAAGVHVKTVSRWLGDRVAPAPGNVTAIASRLGVRVEWLERGDGIMRNGDVPSPLPAPVHGPRRRLPVAVYAVVHDYLTRLEAAKVPVVKIDEAERLMIEAAWTKLAGEADRTDDVMMSDVRAIWSFVHHTLTREGFDLGAPDVRPRRVGRGLR